MTLGVAGLLVSALLASSAIWIARVSCAPVVLVDAVAPGSTWIDAVLVPWTAVGLVLEIDVVTLRIVLAACSTEFM